MNNYLVATSHFVFGNVMIVVYGFHMLPHALSTYTQNEFISSSCSLACFHISYVYRCTKSFPVCFLEWMSYLCKDLVVNHSFSSVTNGFY